MPGSGLDRESLSYRVDEAAVAVRQGGDHLKWKWMVRASGTSVDSSVKRLSPIGVGGDRWSGRSGPATKRTGPVVDNLL